MNVLPYSRNLRLKLIVFNVLLIFISALAARFLFTPIWLVVLIPIPLIAISIYTTYLFLKPLEQLYQAALLYLTTQKPQNVIINTQDEIHSIADVFNKLMAAQYTTVQKTVQQTGQLSSDQQKLQTMLATLEDGVLAVNVNRQIVMANPKAEKLIGIPSAQMINQPLDQVFVIHDTSGRQILAQEYCPLNNNLEGAAYRTEEHQYLTLMGKTGVSSYVGLTSTHVSLATQTDLGWIIDLKDLKKMKDLESIQLDFVSMASHELRTPLTSIKGYLSVFMEENKDKFDNEQKDFLERMSIATNQLASLVDNLLNVSKVERGAFTMNLTPLDWAKIVTTAVDESRINAGQKNIALDLTLPETPLPQVMADQVRIMEVINNLVSNAINYNKPGGWVRVTVKVENNQVITSVSDNGPGIPPEAQQHLFTKFFRVSGALDKSSNSKGTGLGLYLSKNIIDLHHGKIWVESTVGQGSTFSFALPATQAMNTAPSNQAVNDLLKSVQ